MGAFQADEEYELVEIVDHEPHITWFAAFTTYLGYAVLIFLGRIRDLIGVWVGELAAPQPAPKVRTTARPNVKCSWGYKVRA